MSSQLETIIFGGGCFWCTEAVFKAIKGVTSVLSGYAGGTVVNPTYMQVCDGTTGHAEVVKVEYDPGLVELKDLLTIFFASHDPTTVNRQGNDVGTQYRSVIFYETVEQKEIIEQFICDLNESSQFGAPIVTDVESMPVFYPAESYHQDYFAKNSSNSYCQLIINPKLEKVQKQFAKLLKENNI